MKLKEFVIMLAAAQPLVGAVAADTSHGEFYLPPIFSDHMVIQQGALVPVWGEGPNSASRISCRLGDRVTWAHSDNCRHVPRIAGYRNEFNCYLPPLKAGGPYELVLSNETTHAYRVIRDVWVGEVWLASGQSNMALPMTRADPKWSEGTNALLRIYTGDMNGGRWIVADPKSVLGHSAVATFFGNELQKKLGCAVGVISRSCGGTYAENWMSRGALKVCPATRDWIDDYERAQSDPETWVEEKLPEGEIADTGRDPKTADWAKTGADLADWTACDMPSDYRHAFGFPVNGAAWFRRDVVIPKAWAGRELTLRLPAIDKHDIAYFNDVEIGRTGRGFEWECLYSNRVYRVPAKLVKAGYATVAIRMWSWKLGSGFAGGEPHFSLGPEGAEPMPLAGDWLARLERNIGNLGYEIYPKGRTYPDGYTFVRPSSWFDSALKPIIPFAIRGAVWYQGESNACSIDRARDYRIVLPAMVADWRRAWGLGDFPFGIVQLANFGMERRHERVCAWAELRDSQLAASRTIPNAGLASAIDLGGGDIHPPNKLGVGRRLCRWALSEVYGRGDGKPYTGPRCLSGAREKGGRVRIRFTEAEGGIVADGPVRCAFIRGEDGVWHEATVAIDGPTAVFSSPAVSEPQEVRYGWATNPIGATLRGRATGIPVFPFRWKASNLN